MVWAKVNGELVQNGMKPYVQIINHKIVAVSDVPMGKWKGVNRGVLK